MRRVMCCVICGIASKVKTTGTRIEIGGGGNKLTGLILRPVWLEGVFRRDCEFIGMKLLSVLFGRETWEFWWDGDGELRKELPPFQYLGRGR